MSSKERAPRREGHRTTLRLPFPVFEAAASLAQELGTTPNDAIVRLAEEGAAARTRRDRIATLAARRRSAVERAGREDASPFPSGQETRAAMLAGRHESE
ncbi:MAG: hypothetical protein MSC31_00885 [Solirubrobacteraceae bacterium MAG38_C4-C5]|nr:hypothetical protein [Candidatus Siliceabacter maunaloa]